MKEEQYDQAAERALNRKLDDQDSKAWGVKKIGGPAGAL